MKVAKYIDKFGNTIELKEKCWAHIIREHPEVLEFKNRFGELLLEPDYIKRSTRDKSVLLYYKFYDDIFNGKYLLIVIKEESPSLILTSYITDSIKKGETVWERK